MSQRILDAAAHLLEQNAGDVSMAALAAHAGVSRGTIYRRFGSRDQLLAQVHAHRDVAETASRSTRDRILDAFGALIAERGPASVTLDRIATHARVSMMSIYRHFGDRSGLLRAFMQERSPRRLLAELDAESDADVADTLAGFLTEMVRFMAANPGMVRLEFTSDRESVALRTEMRRGVSSSRVSLTRYLQRQIERGRLAAPASGTAMDMTTAMYGAVLAFAHLQTDRATREPARIARFIADALVRGFTQPENTDD